MFLQLEELQERIVPATFNPLAATADGAANSLRDVITTANANDDSNDIINLQAGIYNLAIANTGGAQENANLEGDLDILADTAGASAVPQTVTIIGQGVGATFINANDLDRIFHVVDPGVSLILQNLTITGGLAVDDGTAGAVAGDGAARGGAILHLGSFLTLDSVAVTGKVAQATGFTNLFGSNFAHNAEGGGIYFDGGVGSSLTIRASNVSANQALTSDDAPNGADAVVATSDATAGGVGGDAYGGGIFASGGTGSSVLITNSTISLNLAQGGHGGNGGNGVDSATASQREGSGGGAGGDVRGGGAVLVDFDDVTINPSFITNNKAVGGDGGSDGDGANSATVASGSAGSSGGGPGGDAYGGGLYFSGGGSMSFNLISTTITGNEVSGGTGGQGGQGGDGFGGGTGGRGGAGGRAHGGGVYGYTESGGSLHIITDSTIDANRASGGAGGIGGAGGDGLGTTGFSGGDGNTGGAGGDVSGGRLHLSATEIRIIRTSVSSNFSTGGSGGLGGSGGDGADQAAASSTADSGGSGGRGGAGGDISGGGAFLYVYNNPLDIQNSTFSNNILNGGTAGIGGDGGMPWSPAARAAMAVQAVGVEMAAGPPAARAM